MSKKLISFEGKRPADATLEKLLELRKTLTLEEISKLWNISKTRVWQLEQKAKK